MAEGKTVMPYRLRRKAHTKPARLVISEARAVSIELSNVFMGDSLQPYVPYLFCCRTA